MLVDAANCLYRAFFALPPLRASDGFPTGALHGFTQMLRKVMREERPTAMAVVFDAPGPTFRKELYGEYKATRDAQPEDLSAQFPVAREIAAASGIPVLEVPGFEADDVIASLVAHAPADAEVVIVSTDRDLMQLVGERVVLLDTMRDRRIGPAEVEARFGVPPAQVLDVRALVGDATDNIPGVKGIGEKGAAKLVQEWGSLEAVLDHASEISAKRAREALESQADAARLSKRLATLRTDAPGCGEPSALALRAGDRARLRELYARLELKRLLEGLEDEDAGAPREAQGSLAFGARSPAAPEAAAVAPPEAGPAIETQLALDPRALAALAQELASLPRFALAFVGLEGPGGLPPAPAGVAFAGTPASARYVPLGGEIGVAELAEALAPALGEAGPRRWVARESKRVQTLFAESGIAPALPAFDVELAAFLLDPAAQHGTSVLAARHLGRRLASFEEVAGRGAKAIVAGGAPAGSGRPPGRAPRPAPLLALAEVLAAQPRARRPAPALRGGRAPAHRGALGDGARRRARSTRRPSSASPRSSAPSSSASRPASTSSPASASRSARRSSSRRSSSRSSGCRWRRRRRRATRPTRACSSSSRPTTSCRPTCSPTAGSRSCAAPTSTRCRPS